MFDRDKLPYRKSTLGIVINDQNKFLLVNKMAYKENTEWSFAGGGVDNDETATQALVRELNEELLSTKFEIIGESKFPYLYEWPDETIKKDFLKKGKYYRGTELVQFLVKFLGNENEVKPGDGIRSVKWVTKEELKNYLIFPNQWENAMKVINEFGV